MENKKDYLSNHKISNFLFEISNNYKDIGLLYTPEINERFTKLFKYYKEGNMEENLPENIKLIDNISKNNSVVIIIDRLSSELEIPRKKSLEILNTFLYENNSKEIINLLKRDFLSYPNMEIQSKLNNFINEKIEEIINFYYKERLCLLDNIYNLLQYSFVELPTHDEMANYTRNLLKNSNIIYSLYEIFTSYKNEPIRKKLLNEQNKPEENSGKNKNSNYFYKKEIQILQILKEQEKILDCLNIITNLKDYCGKKIFENFLNYFYETSFCCYGVESMPNNSGLNDKIKTIIDKIIDKSIIFTIINFNLDKIKQFSDLYIDNDDNKEGLTEFLTNNSPFNFDFDILKKFFVDEIGKKNFSTIQITIHCLYKMLSSLPENDNSIPQEIQNNIRSFKQSYSNFYISDEEAFSRFIAMFKNNSAVFNNDPGIENELSNEEPDSNDITSYINNNKLIIYKWIQMVMEIFYDDKVKPQSLICLLTLVLNNTITRNVFYERDFYQIIENSIDEEGENNIINESQLSPIGNLIKEYLCQSDNITKVNNNSMYMDNNNLNYANKCRRDLVNIIFSVMVEKKHHYYNFALFKKLTECTIIKNNEVLEPFFSNVFQIWDRIIDIMNNDVINNNIIVNTEVNYPIENDQEIINTMMKNDIEYLRLFLKLFVYTDNSDQLLMHMSKGLSVITENDEKNLYENLLKNSLNLLKILTKNENKFKKNIKIVKDLFIFLINLIKNEKIKKFFDVLLYNKNYCEVIKEIIYQTITIDEKIKNYISSIYVFKLIKSFFEFDNFLHCIFDKTMEKNGKNFIYSLGDFLNKSIMKYKNKKTLDHPNQLLIIKEINKIINILLCCITYNFNSINITSYNKDNKTNKYNNELTDFIISRLNEIDLINFIFNYLSIQITNKGNDTSNSHKNFSFENIHTYKLKNKYSNMVNKLKYINFINNINKYGQKMIVSLFQNIIAINNIILLYKISKDEEQKKLMYSLNFVSKLSTDFYVNKIIPSIKSEDHGSFSYEINILMLLFTYTNYEFDQDIPFRISKKNYDPSEINDFNKIQNLNYDTLAYGNFRSSRDLNVITCAYNALTQLVYLFQQVDVKNNNNSNNPNKNFANVSLFRIYDLLNIKRIAKIEIEGNNNLFEFIKYTIVRHFVRSPFFINCEIFKFLIICAQTQFSFIINMMSDFKYKDIKENNFIQIFSYFLGNDNRISINYMNNIENDDDSNIKMHNGYVLLFITQIISNELVYKKTVKNLLISNDNKLSLNSPNLFVFSLLNYCLDKFNINKDYMENFNNSLNDLIKHKEIYFNLVLLSNKKLNSICFDLEVIRHIGILFSSLILLTEKIYSNYRKNNNMFSNIQKPKYEFRFNKQLQNFINNHIPNILSLYKLKFNNNLSYILKEKIDSLNNNNFDTTSQFQFVFKNDIVNTNKNIDNVHVLLGNDAFNYGYNYYIDLKNLYIHCYDNEYYKKLFKDSFDKLVINSYNLSMFQMMTSTMHSVEFLLGIIFTIGKNGFFAGSSFFTTDRCFNIIEKYNQLECNINQVLNTIYGSTNVCVSNGSVGGNGEVCAVWNKGTYPVLDFDTLLDVFDDDIGNALSIIKENYINKLVLTNEEFNQYGMVRNNNDNLSVDSDLLIDTMNINIRDNINDFSYYIEINYNIMNYIMDYLLYLIKSRALIPNNPIGNQYKMDSKILISLLRKTSSELDIYLSHNKTPSLQNLIFSIVTQIFYILSYLIQTNYSFEIVDIISINKIMKQLDLCYKNEPELRAIITYIYISYISIDYFISNNNDMNILFNDDDNANKNSNNSNGNIIKSIKAKVLNTDFTEVEYQSFIMLLDNMINLYPIDTFYIIDKNDIFNCLKIKCNNYFVNLNDYESNERTNTHLLFLWTFKFISNLISNLITIDNESKHKFYNIYKYIIEYLIINQERIFYLFNSSEYIDSNKNNVSKNLAFLEELDLFTEIFCGIFIFESESNLQDIKYYKFFYECADLLIKKTLKLFIPNLKIDQVYTCNSLIEKKMKGINLCNIYYNERNKLNNMYMNNMLNQDMNMNLDNINNINNINTNNDSNDLIEGSSISFGQKPSFYNDILFNNKEYDNNKVNAEGNQNINYNQINNLDEKFINNKLNINRYNKNINLFNYKVQQLLLRILYHISMGMTYIFDNKSFSFRQFIKNNYKDNLNSLDLVSKNIINCLNFSVNLLDILNKNINEYKIMNDYLILFYNNVDIGINLDFYNCHLGGVELNDLFEYNHYTIIYLLQLSNEINKCILYFKAYNDNLTNNNFKESFIKCVQNIKNKIRDRDSANKDMEKLKDSIENAVEYYKNLLLGY